MTCISCSSVIDESDVSNQFAPTTTEKHHSAIEVAKADLLRMGVDPNLKKSSIQTGVDGESYFRSRPTDNFWDRGRAMVGTDTVDIITFTEPKPTLGGVHQYFFRGGTNELLWIVRGV